MSTQRRTNCVLAYGAWWLGAGGVGGGGGMVRRPMANTTHQAHRYGAPKVYPYMVKHESGAIGVQDLLLNFIGGLANVEREGLVRVIRNKFGSPAQHIVFKTTIPCADGGVDYWHGTTYQSVPDIMVQGLKNPFDTTGTFQEFKEAACFIRTTLRACNEPTCTHTVSCAYLRAFPWYPRHTRAAPVYNESGHPCGSAWDGWRQAGIYVADRLTMGGALWHAVSTRFSLGEDTSVPFSRIVLKVSCSGRPIARRTYGDCMQLVFDEEQVRIKEIHVFRGLGFNNKGEHFFASVGNIATTWTGLAASAVDVPFEFLDDTSIAADVASAMTSSSSTEEWLPSSGRVSWGWHDGVGGVLPLKGPCMPGVLSDPTSSTATPRRAPLPTLPQAGCWDPWEPATEVGMSETTYATAPDARATTAFPGASPATSVAASPGPVSPPTLRQGGGAWDPWETTADAGVVCRTPWVTAVGVGAIDTTRGLSSEAFPTKDIAHPLPPPAPPAVWAEYVYVDQETGVRRPYFHNRVTDTVQWERPGDVIQAVTATPTPAPAAVVGTQDECPALQTSPSGERWCMACGKRDGYGHAESAKHRSKMWWWSGRSLEERRAWAAYTFSVW